MRREWNVMKEAVKLKNTKNNSYTSIKKIINTHYKIWMYHRTKINDFFFHLNILFIIHEMKEIFVQIKF